MVEILDGICGMGKTHLAITLINNIVEGSKNTSDKKFSNVIYATPYRDECIRMAGLVPRDNDDKDYKVDKSFKPLYKPKSERKVHTKLHPSFSNKANKFPLSADKRIAQLIKENKNIVTTHSALTRLSDETLELAKKKNYKIIIDETPPTIGIVSLDAGGIKEKEILNLEKLNILGVNKNDGLLSWSEEAQDLLRYKDFSDEIKNSRCYLQHYNKDGEAVIVKLLNETIFTALSPTILTYYYKGTLLKPYLEIKNITPVIEDLTSKKYISKAGTRIFDYDMLISIYKPKGLDNEYKTGLSYTKYNNKVKPLKYHQLLDDGAYLPKKGKTDFFSELGKRTRSFFVAHKSHVTRSKAAKKERADLLEKGALSKYTIDEILGPLEEKCSMDERLWTTYKQYRYLVLNGNTDIFKESNFLPFSQKAVNTYASTKKLAYLVNVHLNVDLKTFISQNIPNCEFKEEDYATSELIQWIFRSRIRNGGFIEIFIPSDRMRKLLEKWMKNYKALREKEVANFITDEFEDKILEREKEMEEFFKKVAEVSEAVGKLYNKTD